MVAITGCVKGAEVHEAERLHQSLVQVGRRIAIEQIAALIIFDGHSLLPASQQHPLADPSAQSRPGAAQAFSCILREHLALRLPFSRTFLEPTGSVIATCNFRCNRERQI